MCQFRTIAGFPVAIHAETQREGVSWSAFFAHGKSDGKKICEGFDAAIWDFSSAENRSQFFAYTSEMIEISILGHP